VSPILGIYASQISGHLFAPSGAYDSIATVTVGSGGSSSISFSSIPSTYTHLQIRSINRNTRGLSGMVATLAMSFNSDVTAGNYYRHRLEGDGSTAYAGANAGNGTNGFYFADSMGDGSTSGMFSGFVTDILDYKSTNKNKTVRTLFGGDNNSTGGVIGINSGLWSKTPEAITSITIVVNGGYNFTQYSSFALYGIKGA
jgi:hypothetical protein